MSEVVVHPTEGDVPEDIVAAVLANKQHLAALEADLAKRDIDLRHAREERQLLAQLQTVDELALAKLSAAAQRNQERTSRMKVSEETVARIIALKDELKVQAGRSNDLVAEAALTEQQAERLEAGVAEQEEILAVVEDSTGYCSTPGHGGKPYLAPDNVFGECKKQLSLLEAEQRTVKATLGGLTNEIEALTMELEERKAVEDHTLDAKDQLEQLVAEQKAKQDDLQQLKRIMQRKEKMLEETAKKDDLKALQQLEGDKRVLHSELSKQMDLVRVSQKAVLANDDRLQKIEAKLDAVAAFLARTFAEVQDDDPVAHRPADLPEDATEVPIADFNALVAELVVLRRTLEERDEQLECLDAQVESSEKKVDIVHVAQVSRTAIAAQEFQEMERERMKLVSNVELIQGEFECERDRLLAERERIEMLLAE